MLRLWTAFQSRFATEEDGASMVEYALLVAMANSGLPVPVPVAAHVRHKKALYQADIVTERISGAATFTQLLTNGDPEDKVWTRIGSCIRKFHEHGIFHADLNAHNILIDDHERIWLIDFDRSFQTHLSRRFKNANLRRLLRSLHKVCPEELRTGRHIADGWRLLLQGYAEQS